VEQHSFSAMGQTYIRYVFSTGEGLPKHIHDVDHLTIVASGKIKASTDTKEVERTPQDPPILFRASRFHEIIALEDNTVVLNVFEGGHG
jgi:quercetin dioxygenase-like cupin family protein